MVEWLTTITTGIGLIFIWWQIREARKTANSQFLLQLHEMFRNYDELNQELSQDNRWKPPEGEGKPSWLDVYSYIGLFERVKILADRGQISFDEINRLYAYRIYWILRNEHLRIELIKNDGQWKDFIQLCKNIADLKTKNKSSNLDIHFLHLVDELPMARERDE